MILMFILASSISDGSRPVVYSTAAIQDRPCSQQQKMQASSSVAPYIPWQKNCGNLYESTGGYPNLQTLRGGSTGSNKYEDSFGLDNFLLLRMGQGGRAYHQQCTTADTTPASK